MSSASGAGAPAPSGVVRSSALTFVAPAQPPTTADSIPGNSQDIKDDMSQAGKMFFLFRNETTASYLLLTCYCYLRDHSNNWLPNSRTIP